MVKHGMHKLAPKVEEKLSGTALATTAPCLSVKLKTVSPCFKLDTEQLKDQDLPGIHGTREVSVRGGQFTDGVKNVCPRMLLTELLVFLRPLVL